ncbi:T-cell surface glycoprotein CD3 zeta chain [Electrophorus electricus]|uniref:T-cell surface glycoprotein CD3 zeta chain n=1 Tax=Electrophorus electricus TaxID=8005 RepID=A0A4W4FL09_ELEEL|nr:T-cell surface glycoprotein CD3 zeta chain [Electrophorus electricus]
MRLQKACVLVLLITQISLVSAEGNFLYDPKFCYILDVFLLSYGIIITGLFLRERYRKPKTKSLDDSDYQVLREGNQITYDRLRQRDAEGGRAHGRRRPQEDTYTPLQKKPEDPYREIQVKKDRRQDQVYQGLSSASKDTYDSLHMQPLPPRR